jgi:hypothetical protein
VRQAEKTVELFLNILWLVFALGALAAWRAHWLHQPRPQPRTPLQQWTALGCALVLLFFAVSLSDDLRAEIVFVEECTSGRRESLVTACPHHQEASAAIHPAAPMVLPQLDAFQVCFEISLLSHRPVGVATAIAPSDRRRGRAPPLVIL